MTESSWKTLRLGDVCKKIGSGATPRGGKDVYLPVGNTSLVRSQNVYNNRFETAGLVFLTDTHAQELNNVELEPDDVLLNITGDSVARCTQVPESILPARVNQHVAIIRPNDEFLDATFLRYVLVSPFMQETLLSLAGAGATRNALTKGMIEGIAIRAPDVPAQRRIADILATLDEKIELNRRMNQTLEAMARRLFKSWFMDFNPVHAKATLRRQHPKLSNADLSRRALPNMTPEIAELFPDEFEDSTLGPIPKGWRLGKVSELALKTGNGGTPKRSVSEYWEPAEVPWLTSGEVRQAIVTDTEQKISELGLSKSAAKLWPAWTTVVALYGATAGQATITAIPLSANQACCGLQPREEYRLFQYIALSGATELLAQQARGSAQQNLSKQIVEDLQIVIPDQATAAEYESKISPMFEAWVANLNEATDLANARDKLLPRLLSGQLEISDGAKP